MSDIVVLESEVASRPVGTELAQLGYDHDTSWSAMKQDGGEGEHLIPNVPHNSVFERTAAGVLKAPAAQLDVMRSRVKFTLELSMR